MTANQTPEPRALTSALLSSRGFRHGFSLAPLDFRRLSEAGAALSAMAGALGIDAAAIYQASQVHGARVVVAHGDASAMLREEADAIVARASGVTAGVRVADCTPVLVGDEASGHVVAIHAGWRGVVAAVVRAGLEALAARGEIVAAIGPSIGICCFEVGEDVAEKIATACGDASVVVRSFGAKPHVDMRRAVRAQLVAAGVDDANIDDIPGCTKCGGARFHSHRRDGERAGRHLAVIEARASR